MKRAVGKWVFALGGHFPEVPHSDYLAHVWSILGSSRSEWRFSPSSPGGSTDSLRLWRRILHKTLEHTVSVVSHDSPSPFPERLSKEPQTSRCFRDFPCSRYSGNKKASKNSAVFWRPELFRDQPESQAVESLGFERPEH